MMRGKFSKLRHWFSRQQLKGWEKTLRRDGKLVTARKIIGMNSGDDSVLLDAGRIMTSATQSQRERENGLA